MGNKYRLMLFVGLAGVAGLLFVFLRTDFGTRTRTLDEPPLASIDYGVSSSLVQESTAKGFAMVGGVFRPENDVSLSKSLDERKPLVSKSEGHPAILTGVEHPQVQQVVDALKTGKNPERYDSFIVKRTFDNSAFQKNPELYARSFAATVEPGRVFATAQPGGDVPVIKPNSAMYHRVTQGEVVRLETISSSFAPVTFTSMDLGEFSNRLSSITVVSDENGNATAEFVAASGTKDDVRILAASPVTTEQIRFTVNVSLAK